MISLGAPDALSHSLVLHPNLHKCFKEKKHHEQDKIHHDLHFGKMTSSSSSANFTSLVNKNHSSLTNHSTFHHPVSFIPRTFRQRFGQAHPVGETTASAIEAHGVGFFFRSSKLEGYGYGILILPRRQFIVMD